MKPDTQNSSKKAPFDIVAATGLSAQEWADDFIEHGTKMYVDASKARGKNARRDRAKFEPLYLRATKGTAPQKREKMRGVFAEFYWFQRSTPTDQSPKFRKETWRLVAPLVMQSGVPKPQLALIEFDPIDVDELARWKFSAERWAKEFGQHLLQRNTALKDKEELSSLFCTFYSLRSGEDENRKTSAQWDRRHKMWHLVEPIVMQNPILDAKGFFERVNPLSLQEALLLLFDLAGQNDDLPSALTINRTGDALIKTETQFPNLKKKLDELVMRFKEHHNTEREAVRIYEERQTQPTPNAK